MRWPAKLILVATLGAVAGAVVPASVAVAADGFHVDLRYDVPGSPRRCWDEAGFKRSVAHRLGYDPFRAGAPIRVLVRVTGSARAPEDRGALEGQIDWRAAGGAPMGERRIVAKNGDCSALLAEVSFAVGLQIELLQPRLPTAAEGATPATAPAAASAPLTQENTPATASGAPPVEASSTQGGAPAEEAPRRADSPRPEVADVRARAERQQELVPAALWSMSLGAGPALAWGLSPSLTADGRLFVEARRRALSFELAGEASYPSTTHQTDGLGFRQSLLGGTLAVCGHRQALSACAVGRASQVRVTGLDVDRSRSPTGLAVQAGARLAATVPLGGPWSAAAHVDLLGLITPYRVTLNQASVWDMPRLAGLAGLTVGARFR